MIKTMAKPRKPKKRDDSTESVLPMSIRLDSEIAVALQKFIDAQRYRTTKTDVIEVALQELLKAEGFWPPGTVPPPEE